MIFLLTRSTTFVILLSCVLENLCITFSSFGDLVTTLLLYGRSKFLGQYFASQVVRTSFAQILFYRLVCRCFVFVVDFIIAYSFYLSTHFCIKLFVFAFLFICRQSFAFILPNYRYCPTICAEAMSYMQLDNTLKPQRLQDLMIIILQIA